MPQPSEAPAVVPWPQWRADFAARWRQGQHLLFVGPAGSGKTVLARDLAWMRLYVVVLGTKLRDPEMDQYLADGYRRIETWPPPRAAMKPDEHGAVRLVLWPKIKTRLDLRRFRPVYAACLDDVLSKGGWTVVADEGLWLSARDGLALGEHLSAIAYAGRSSGATLLMVIQRPAGVPRNCWSNASDAFIWKLGVTTDLRELASLSTENPRDVVAAIRVLEGHEFLDLPCRAGALWSISEVQL